MMQDTFWFSQCLHSIFLASLAAWVSESWHSFPTILAAKRSNDSHNEELTTNIFCLPVVYTRGSKIRDPLVGVFVVRSPYIREVSSKTNPKETADLPCLITCLCITTPPRMHGRAAVQTATIACDGRFIDSGQ